MQNSEPSGRNIGLEQEFFLVDEAGHISDRADEFLARCRAVAAESELNKENFSGECTFGMVEVKTGAHRGFDGLKSDYLRHVGAAIRAAREAGVRLYPLGTYPLPFTPDFRHDGRYEAQVRTIGRERFMPAGRCVGVHMHFEVMDGVVDRDEVIAQDAPLAGVSELVRLYNLMTAMDPALISLTRSCPYYEGRRTKLAARTAFYRGSEKFGWDGVYSKLPELGGLHPYAKNAEDLVNRQMEGREVWLRAMEQAGTDAELGAMSNTILDLCWRPVRISQNNTVEVRSLDGNYPHLVLATAALLKATVGRVTGEGLTVEPGGKGLETFEERPGRLCLPDFEFVGGELLEEAVTRGVESEKVRAYLDSLFDFATEGVGAGPEEGRAMRELRDRDGLYRTTEAEVCRTRTSRAVIDREEGLALVLEACDLLEAEIAGREAVASERTVEA
ncbi:glutamate-cysteine ligase family protein [Rubrobacter indicoceani]|uniref:glutamate-cysteine ligase family protein n=1 Tax=Rubrobacter indicoceani TaxID=2051957 RepID=UPI0013C531E6|nr:glutamate-cysteine ligase family protein [Rubrobacter indicoceani]